MKPARALAIRLLEENREEIAAGIYRLMCKLVPSYRAVDAHASAKNGVNLIKCYEVMLRDDDATAALAFVEQMRAQRQASGYQKSDLAIATHVYLPVMRKAFLARAPDVRAGVAAFDELEGALLPVIARWLHGLLDPIGDEPTLPGVQTVVPITVDDAVPEFMLGDD